MSWPKRCNCCGTEHNEQDWSRLHLVGVQEDEVCRLELRDCPCNSTLAVPVVVYQPEHPDMRATP